MSRQGLPMSAPLASFFDRMLCILILHFLAEGCCTWLLLFLFTIVIPVMSIYHEFFIYKIIAQIFLSSASILSFATLTSRRDSHMNSILSIYNLNNDFIHVLLNYSTYRKRFLYFWFYVSVLCVTAIIFSISLGGLFSWLHFIFSIAELISAIYRITNFLVACVMFDLTCQIQFLSLEDLVSMFRIIGYPVQPLHTTLRSTINKLEVISGWFQWFILLLLILVITGEFAVMLLAHKFYPLIPLSGAINLLEYLFLVAIGLLACLSYAAKITHKTQELAKHAAQWHANNTINGEENDKEMGSSMQSHYHVSFERRRTLVGYVEHNIAGITLFGFKTDWTFLLAMFTTALSFTFVVVKQVALKTVTL